MATVFFSYSHADEHHRDRLEKSLAMLRHQGLIEAWHDRRIVVGDALDASISKALERADLILLLVSPDFLASNYCYNVEMTRALERHRSGEARIIPIILRSCDWKSSPLSGLLATPKDGKPITKWADLDEAYQNVAESVRAALPKTNTAMSNLAATPIPSSVVAQRHSQPRSSNLRLAKRFSEADRDRFLHEAFDYIANFFDGSLTELKARNSGIDTSFRRIDANRFTAVIYRDGQAKARCKIMLGGVAGYGISYASDDRAPDNTMNESMNVAADDQSLYLNPLGMAHFSSGQGQHLTFEGAAEYYWAMLITPLQRS